MKNKITLLLVCALSIAVSNAQTIPNASFENWTSMGSYNNLDAWSTLNDMTASMSTFTCVKGTPGQVGAAYLKLTSKNVTGMGIMPGMAVCGTVDMATLQPTSGFAFVDRPSALTGKWQYMASGADQGFIAIALTKWDNTMMMRDTIASVYYPLSGMAMSWANFSIPITYLNGNDPDSCIIILSASQANGAPTAANSYLYVDGLNFTGIVANVSHNTSTMDLVIFPNPTSDKLNIDLSVLNNKKATIKIVDVTGKEIRSIEIQSVNEKTQLDISDLPKGNYILKVISSGEVITNNFIKQ